MRLLITGFPGWLADAFLDSIQSTSLRKVTKIRCVVAPWTDLDQVRKSRSHGAAAHDAEIVAADLRDKDIVPRVVDDCELILHTAAILHPRRISEFYAINRDATVQLARAALCHEKLHRFIFVSSNAAAGRAAIPGHLLTEEDPPKPLSYYGDSKLQAERALLAVLGRRVTILRPCMFYGPPVPPRHVEIYRRLQRGRMPLVGGGGFARSVTHIDHIVQACRLALGDEGELGSGETLFVADEPIYTTKDVILAMASALEVVPKFVALPQFVAPAAYAVDRLVGCFGRYWQTAHLVGEADWHVGVSSMKAQRLLGYRPTRTLAEGMSAAVEWCRVRGLLST